MMGSGETSSGPLDRKRWIVLARENDWAKREGEAGPDKTGEISHLHSSHQLLNWHQAGFILPMALPAGLGYTCRQI